MDSNSQQTNENLDRLHPEWPAQYVLINEQTGTVVWYESYQRAVTEHKQYGGIIINTENCPKSAIQAALDAARARMNVFDKPSGEELALIPRRENGTIKWNNGTRAD